MRTVDGGSRVKLATAEPGRPGSWPSGIVPWAVQQAQEKAMTDKIRVRPIGPEPKSKDLISALLEKTKRETEDRVFGDIIKCWTRSKERMATFERLKELGSQSMAEGKFSVEQIEEHFELVRRMEDHCEWLRSLAEPMECIETRTKRSRRRGRHDLRVRPLRRVAGLCSADPR
jgi:hypothetical protein